MNLLYQTKEIQPERGNTVSRRGLLTGAVAVTAATGAAAFQMPDAPAAPEMPQLPEWWKRLVQDVRDSEVPHRNPGFVVVRRSATDALYEEAGVAEAKVAAQDPHPAWLDEWKQNRAAYNAHPTGEGPEAKAFYARMWEIEGLMSATKATSAAGIAAQIEWVIEETGSDLVFDGHGEALASALSGLRGMA